MKKVYEFEAKCLINENDYNNIINNENIISRVTQTNYYFDNDDYLKDNNMALRIRKKDNTYELTLKTKTENGNVEKNIDIDVDTFNNMVNNHVLDKVLCDQLEISISTFNSLKVIKTTRSSFNFNNHIIEVDFNTFDQAYDYEIEIESSCLELAYDVLNQLLDKYNITKLDSAPKIARYDWYN